VTRLRLATWNVNSLRARVQRVEEWLRRSEPDVVCLQETKCADDAFPAEAFAALGYAAAHHGNGPWNGVAILSRVGLAGVRAGFLDEAPGEVDECRILSATCGSIRVVSVYVPNGRAVGSPQYAAKLAWLRRLRAELDATARPDELLALCGDFNVAPEDRDVFDISRFEGMTHVTGPERAALAEVLGWGLEDVTRAFHPDEVGPFSWWDYRGGAFHKGEGMRIDLALCSRPLAARAVGAFVDREARKKGSKAITQPSDHAPVVVDFDLA